MRTMGRWAWLCLPATALILTGCGDDETGGTGASSVGGSGATGGEGGTTGGSGGSSGGSGGSGGGETVTYEVTVRDFSQDAIEGAGVAIDMMDGSRFEALTDATGIAILDVPADVEPYVYIAHKDGYSFTAVPLALQAGETEVAAFLMVEPDTSADIQVSGNVANMTDPVGSELFVVATPGGAFVGEGVTAYDLLVPPSTDYTLSAFEASVVVGGQDVTRTFENVWTSPQTGIAAPTTLDIDFADPAPASTPIALSLAAPADAALATSGLAVINALSNRGPCGGSTTCAHDAANGEYDCVGFLFDMGAPVNQTVYIVGDEERLGGGYGRQTLVAASGAPPSGQLDLDFVNAPDVTAPTGAGPHPVDDLVQYSVAADGGAYDFVLTNIFAGERLVGVAFGNEGELRVPELPSSSNADAHYEPSMDFMLLTCRTNATGSCTAAGSELWEASPPAN